MQLARTVSTSVLLLVLSLAGFVAGCDSGLPVPIPPAEDQQIRESKKQAHREVMEDAKNTDAATKNVGAGKKGAHRGSGRR